MSDTHKIIAVYGNSGSYKTVTAISLAKAIIKADSSAEAVIVGLDATKPFLPCLFPKEKTKASLGALLSLEYFDQDSILTHLIMKNRIGALGYNNGENINSYAFPIDGRIDDFYMQMRHLVNYTIIDCTSDIAAHKLTAKAIINADEVICLLSADINGLLFYHSQESILLSEQYRYRNFKRYLSISNKFRHDTETLKNAITQVHGIIPFSQNVVELYNEGTSLEAVSDPKYIKAVSEIAKTLMEE